MTRAFHIWGFTDSLATFRSRRSQMTHACFATDPITVAGADRSVGVETTGSDRW
jgi:hypothetical protein